MLRQNRYASDNYINVENVWKQTIISFKILQTSDEEQVNTR